MVHASVILAFKCMGPTLNERDTPPNYPHGLACCGQLTDGSSDFELIGLCQVSLCRGKGYLLSGVPHWVLSERACYHGLWVVLMGYVVH